MGGDLTQGTVKGDEIACPFHDWRWGGDGKCKAIPYARRVPLRARTQKYPVEIRNGQVMIWHDVEGSEPDLDVLPPVLDGVGTDAFTDWTWEVLDVPSAHCREIIDNVVDMAHFFYIHFAFPTSFRNVFEGHVATQFMESKGRPDMGGSGYGDADLVLKSEASYFGPSYMVNWLWVDYKGFETEVILINCHVPTGDNSFKLQYGVCVQASPRASTRRPRSTSASATRTPSRRGSSRTCTSGSTRPRCRTRCCARRTGRSTSCVAGTSSSTSTRPTSSPR